MIFSRELHILLEFACSKKRLQVSNNRHNETEDLRHLYASAQLQSDSLKRHWLKSWLPCPDGGVSLPFVQPWNCGWISWDSCTGSKYGQWLGRLGVTMSCIIRMFSINSSRSPAKNKRLFLLHWKYVQLYFQTDGNTAWVWFRWSQGAGMRNNIGAGVEAGGVAGISSVIPCSLCTLTHQNFECWIPAASMRC